MSTFVGLKYVNLTFTSSGWQRADRLGALWGDPNYYSVHLILAIAILIVWYSQERIKLPLFIVGYSALAVFGGLLGEAPVMPVNNYSCEDFISRKGRIPAPVHSFNN